MKKISISAIAIFFSVLSFGQITIEDVTLPAKYNNLELNGGGLREKYFLDLYVGGLYLETKSSDAKAIMEADKPMSIKLHIVSGLIDSKKMIDATEEGFEKSTGGKQESMRVKIDAFKDAFKEEIKVGDIYDIFYTPGKGTEIFKNDKSIKVIEGLEFKKSLFGIWLCDEPADEDLKEGMLGK